MIILPSLLAAPQLQLHKAIEEMMDLGLNHFHIDMMDYHFTHNFGLTPSICKAIIQSFPNATLDVHLMTNPTPLQLIDQLLDLEIYNISLHPHTLSEHDLSSVKNNKAIKLRMAMLPHQDISEFIEYPSILALAVNPGFSHQKMHANVLHNVNIATSNNIDVMLDGGVNLESAQHVKKAKPSSVVVGGGLFGKSRNEQKQLIHQLTGLQG